MGKYSRKRTKKLKRFWTMCAIIFLVFFMIVWLYIMYSRITIADSDLEQTNTIIQRTSQTVNQVKQEDKKIEDVIEEVTKSVVGISKIKNNGSSIFWQDGAEQLGLGTGIIVSENGYIVTNEHVSGGKYSNCYVTLEDGKVYNATVVWADSDIDLSIIKINMKNLSYVKLGDSDEIKTGQSVYAIGNPIGFEFQRTVTSGIISATERTIKFKENNKEVYMSDLIQTDATINPGNSGGPLISPDGYVIGVNSVKITSAEGIGFAIPINVIKPIIQKYIQTGEFEEATMGVFAYDKNVIPYLDSNLKFDTGIYVAQLVTNSPAEKAGIKIGDIITKIDGIEVNKMSDVREYIYTKKPNEEITVTIQRNASPTNVKLVLGKK